MNILSKWFWSNQKGWIWGHPHTTHQNVLSSERFSVSKLWELLEEVIGVDIFGHGLDYIFFFFWQHFLNFSTSTTIKQTEGIGERWRNRQWWKGLPCTCEKQSSDAQNKQKCWVGVSVCDSNSQKVETGKPQNRLSSRASCIGELWVQLRDCTSMN